MLEDDNRRRPWTRDELLLAINLYCKTTFGRIHIRNPEIIALAKLLGRTPGSVSYKLANFASIDENLDRKGASNVSNLDRAVWAEFFADWDGMVFESERRMAELRGVSLEAAVRDEAEVDGESIIIPIAISTLDTTKSIIKKGKNKINPI